jgi:hypothetical protein
MLRAEIHGELGWWGGLYQGLGRRSQFIIKNGNGRRSRAKRQLGRF